MHRHKVNAGIALACLLLFFSGCRTSDVDVVVGPPDEEKREYEQEAASDVWEELDAQRDWEEERMVPEFVSPRKAPMAPRLEAENRRGNLRTINPAGNDKITILVFWSMDSWLAASAALHAEYLTRIYGRYGVEAIGFVENAPSFDSVVSFKEKNSILFNNYYDDFSAHQRLASVAGREVGYELPCFFIVDSEGKLRFSKIGFSPSGVADTFSGSELSVTENAPRGERIEDYLRKLITEKK